MRRRLLVLVAGLAASMPLHAQQGHKELIDHVAGQVVPRTIHSATQQAEIMHAEVNQQCRDTSLTDRGKLQEHWQALISAWMKVEPFALGPVTADNRDFKIHFWPVRKSKVALLFDQSYEMAELNDFSVAGRGLAGLEYVLFDPQLTLSDTQRCRYLSQVAKRLLVDLRELRDEWPAYARAMQNVDRDNPYFLASQDVINLLLGKLIQHSEGILKRKLGAPAGLKSKGKPKPFKSESWRSSYSLQNLLANLDAYEALMADVAWEGFREGEQADVIHALVKVLRSRIATSRDVINSTNMPLKELVLQDNDKAMQLYNIFNEVANDWRAIARALHVAEGFNDNDGD